MIDVPSKAAATSATGRKAPTPVTDLPLAEHVCLALIGPRVSHGWAIGTLLAPQGEIGRVWTLSRPLTYRAIDGLVDKGLAARTTQATGHGRDRAILTTTPAGRAVTKRWLQAPVVHLRDVRTELLAKLTLRTRAGLDNRHLLAAQSALFEPTIESLTGAGSGGGDLVDLWRRESSRAIRRFLDDALHPLPTPANGPQMRLSARNQIRGTVVAVRRGELMASVRAVLGDGQALTATITQEAADDLDIAAGDTVLMVVKATEVMVAKGSLESLVV